MLSSLSLNKVKRLFVILWFSLAFSGHAQAHSAHISYENEWYQRFHDYEMLLTPITDAVVCASVAGAPGFVGGFLLGVLDEALVQSQWSSQRHLSMGLLAASFGSNLPSPYHLTEILGFILGMGLSSGHIVISHSQIERPTASMLAGMTYAQRRGFSVYQGAISGFCASLLDQSGWYERPILSESLITLSTAAVFMPLVAKILGHVSPLSAFSAHLNQAPIAESIAMLIMSMTWHNPSEQDTFKGISNPEQLKTELQKVFSRVTGSDVVSDLSRNQLVYKLSASILSAQLSNTLYFYQKSSLTSLTALSRGEQGSAHFKSYSIFLLPYFLHKFADYFVQNYQSETLAKLIKFSARDKILSEKSALHLKTKMELSVDVEKFGEHLNVLVHLGIPILWSTTDSYVKGLRSGLVLWENKSLEMLYLMKFFNSFLQSANSHLESLLAENNHQVFDLQNDIQKLENDIKKEAKTLILGHKLDFLRQKIKDLDGQIRLLQSSQFIPSLLYSQIYLLRTNFNELMIYALMAAKVSQGELAGAAITPTLHAVETLLDSGDWFARNQAELQSIYRSLESVSRVLDHLDKPCDPLSTLKVDHQAADLTSLEWENFQLGFIEDSSQFLDAGSLKLDAGRYVLTGVKGSGKSSFLSKLSGVSCNGIFAHGHIEFKSKDPSSKIYQVTQMDYFPIKASLIEIMSGKTHKQWQDHPERSDFHDRAQIMLRSFQLPESVMTQLEQVRNWGDILSPGEKRVVALVTMLLQKPDFVILDETFAGLDRESIKIAQNWIRSELKHSVVLVVDHEFLAHNNDGFYDHELRLENKTLGLKSLPLPVF